MVTGSGATPADRFLSAWKRLEAELSRRWNAEHRDRREPDAAAVLSWAGREHLFAPDAAEFLHSCRVARNAYAHVSFEGYDGPVTHPPTEVVHRLERILASLRSPARLSSIADRAVTCSAESTLRDALAQMGQQDFSQLPYRLDALGWTLVTREQVSRWLEVEADADGTALADLTLPVRMLAEHPRVGPVVPRELPGDATIPQALQELEAALRTPDSDPGGYAAVLIGAEDAGGPRLLASDDVPRLYALLGR